MKLKSFVFMTMAIFLECLVTTQAADLPKGPHISTSGSAVVRAEPDMATIRINVEMKEKDVVTAKAQVDKRVSNYFSFLKGQEVKKQAIETANISISPYYEYDKERQISIIKGYSASRSVSVEIYDLKKLNTLLDGALKSGFNDIHSIQFGVREPEKYRAEARQNAIKTAIAQAKDVAKGFGRELGNVYSIGYNSPQAVPFVRHSKTMMATAPMEAPVEETYEQQTIDFNDRVDVVFELKQQ